LLTRFKYECSPIIAPRWKLKKIGIGFAPAILMIYTILSSGLLSNVVTEETMIVPLQGGENGVYTTEIFHVPLFISDVKIDVSVKMNTYLWVWCELRIGNQLIAFNLNDMSVSYHIEHDIVQLDGKISEQAVSFKATIDTDGEIEEVPKLVLTFYSL